MAPSDSYKTLNQVLIARQKDKFSMFPLQKTAQQASKSVLEKYQTAPINKQLYPPIIKEAVAIHIHASMVSKSQHLAVLKLKQKNNNQ